MAENNLDSLFLKKVDLEDMDVLKEIRNKLDKMELQDKLKKVWFGGYSKKSVGAVVDEYKKIISWMQDTFEFQIEEVEREKDKFFGERAVLKKQLNEELEKKRDYEGKEKQLAEMKDRLGLLKRKVSMLEKERERLLSANKRLEEEKNNEKDNEKDKELLLEQQQKLKNVEKEYALLKQQYEELEDGIESQGAAMSGGGMVSELSAQLENMTMYCESLEKERESLGKQISSIKTINQELERISQEFDLQKEELGDYQKKYLDVKMENTSLCNEMESTSKVLEEILQQLEQNEAEKESLKTELEQEKRKIVKIMKEKLELQNQNVLMTEEMYLLQDELRLNKDELNKTLSRSEDNSNDNVVYLENSKSGSLQRKLEDEEKAREAINQAKRVAKGIQNTNTEEKSMKEVK